MIKLTIIARMNLTDEIEENGASKSRLMGEAPVGNVGKII